MLLSAKYIVVIPEEENLNTKDPRLVEGDIMLTPEEKALGRGSVGDRLWPGGVLVYEIESSLCKFPLRSPNN